MPLHFTAFHPDFRMLDTPPTPKSDADRAREIARAAGLRYVYTGNVHDEPGQSTYCPGCGARVIGRDWYRITRLAAGRRTGAAPNAARRWRASSSPSREPGARGGHRSGSAAGLTLPVP